MIPLTFQLAEQLPYGTILIALRDVRQYVKAGKRYTLVRAFINETVVGKAAMIDIKEDPSNFHVATDFAIDIFGAADAIDSGTCGSA